MQGGLHKRRTFLGDGRDSAKVTEGGVLWSVGDFDTKRKHLSTSKSVGTIVDQVEGISGNVMILGKIWKPKIVGHSLGFFEKSDRKCW